MKKAKKRLSKRPATDAEFAERTGELQRLRNQFPKIIDEMIGLLIAENKDCEHHMHEFALELGNIAYVFGRRLNSRVAFNPPSGLEMHLDYLGNQNHRRETLEMAVQLLTALIADLRQLDVLHLMKFARSYRSPFGRTTFSSPSELFLEIESATRVIAACQAAYSSTFPVRPVRKGRRPVPYVESTQALISLWKEYTGKKVPISKTHKGQIITKAAQFIRLGVSLIDPGVSDAKVVTAINNSLSSSL